MVQPTKAGLESSLAFAQQQRQPRPYAGAISGGGFGLQQAANQASQAQPAEPQDRRLDVLKHAAELRRHVAAMTRSALFDSPAASELSARLADAAELRLLDAVKAAQDETRRVADLEGENATLRARVREWRVDALNHRRRADGLERELEALRAQLGDSQSARCRLATEKAHLKHELERAAAPIRDLPAGTVVHERGIPQELVYGAIVKGYAPNVDANRAGQCQALDIAHELRQWGNP